MKAFCKFILIVGAIVMSAAFACWPSWMAFDYMTRKADEITFILPLECDKGIAIERIDGDLVRYTREESAPLCMGYTNMTSQWPLMTKKQQEDYIKQPFWNWVYDIKGPLSLAIYIITFLLSVSGMIQGINDMFWRIEHANKN